MPLYTVLSRVDSYSDYVTQVEADSPEEAVDLVYEGSGFQWEHRGVVEFDAVHMVALDDQGEEIDGYSRGKG